MLCTPKIPGSSVAATGGPKKGGWATGREGGVGALGLDFCLAQAPEKTAR